MNSNCVYMYIHVAVTTSNVLTGGDNDDSTAARGSSSNLHRTFGPVTVDMLNTTVLTESEMGRKLGTNVCIRTHIRMYEYTRALTHTHTQWQIK
jgi:hypothetical protein